MGGGVMLDEPYENYAYPFGERWVPVYESSFPTRRSSGRGNYNAAWENNANSHPSFVFEDPSLSEQNLARKRRLDALKGQRISGRDQIARDRKAPSPFASQMRSSTVDSTTLTPVSLPHNVDAPNSATGKPTDRGTPKSAIASIPVILSTEMDDNKSVRPGEETRRPVPVVEAAVLIQSWFRGRLVRRRQPLIQLRVIAKVKSQLRELKVQTSDADFIDCARVDPKARLRLSESILNLLLQLDAIQGAHSSVREVRKSVTKEVFVLEEKVESLLSSKTAVVELLEPSMNTSTEECSGNRLDQLKSIAVADMEDRCGNNGGEEVKIISEVMTGRQEIDNGSCGNSTKQTTVLEPDQKTSWNGGADPSHDCLIPESVEVDTPGITAGINSSKTREVDGLKSESCPPFEGLKQLDNEGVGASQNEEAPKSVELHDLVADARKLTRNDERILDSVEPESAHPVAGAEPVAIIVQNAEWTRVQDLSQTESGYRGTHDSAGSQEIGRSEDSSTLQQRTSDKLREGSEEDVNDLKDKFPATQDLSVHRVQVESSSSPRAVHYVDTLVCVPDRDHLSDAEEALERHQNAQSLDSQREVTSIVPTLRNASADGSACTVAAEGLDNRALLKLSEENQELMSLLINTVKLNQFHAAAMMHISHKLDKLGKELLRRRWKEKTEKSMHGRLSRASRVK